MSDTDNEEIIEIETEHEKRVRIPDEKQIESFGRVKISWIAAGVLAAAAIVLTVWVAVSYIGRDDTYAAEKGKGKDVILDEGKSEEAMTPVEDAAEEEDDTVSENTPNYREIHTLDDFGSEKWNEGFLKYDGEIYNYDPELQTYLFMGIDNDHMVGPAEDGYSGGQSDGMFLMVVDPKADKVNIVAINRNTVVPVDVYDEDGSFLARKDYQICIQHGYGDGMKLSCMRSVEAVQRLFRDIPIAGYLSLNMGGLPAVNDAVGGVEITPIQSIDWRDAGIKEGETVNLNGKQAYSYVRYRDINEFASADRRLERQKQYMTAFAEKVLAEPSLAKKVINAGSDYMVASIDLSRIADSARDLDFDPDDVYTIPGHTELAGEHEAYYPDEDGLIKLILDVFYKKVSQDKQ